MRNQWEISALLPLLLVVCATKTLPFEATEVSEQAFYAKRIAAPTEARSETAPEPFIGVLPEQNCPVQVGTATLHNTYWRLVLLGHLRIERFSDQNEPYLIFRESGEVDGSDGCNRFSGRYVSTNGLIELSELTKTDRKCAKGAEQAKTFTAVLARVNRTRIVGQQMQFLDEDGTPLMSFAAVVSVP